MKESVSPYKGLPAERFWNTGVAQQAPTEVENLYRKKFAIAPSDRIATAGSCFAQHIANQLRKHGFNVVDEEPAPPGLSVADAQRFGYGLYSARYGNIYHVRQLLQLAKEAFGEWKPADYIWEKEGRFYDAMRPSVEPEGLPSPESVVRHRNEHLKYVKKVLSSTDVLVFTLGLTEGWVHRDSGTVYPTAPGTIAGSYDGTIHNFHNFGFAEIYADFLEFRDLLKALNPSARFLLTVSPVPLTATAAPQHVLSATTYSKAVLRAVAGQLSETCVDVDYFPSYELIGTPFSRSMFYHPNLRTVTQAGVQNVMRVFFAEHANPQEATQENVKNPSVLTAEEIVCEEIILESFAA